MTDLEARITPIFDLSAISDEVRDRLADLIWEQISDRMLHAKVEVLSLAPEDVIVLSTSHNLKVSEAESLKERAQAIFGTANKVVVLADGMELKAVRAEDAASL